MSSDREKAAADIEEIAARTKTLLEGDSLGPDETRELLTRFVRSLDSEPDRLAAELEKLSNDPEKVLEVLKEQKGPEDGNS